jgi:poly-gamma-glutamate synthesis protein (capsule biosynthesis protein)
MVVQLWYNQEQARREERQEVRGIRRRGISFGTVFMLLITIGVAGACAVVLPRLAGNMEQRIDTQQIANAITSSLDLPELSLSDIPIFPKPADTVNTATVPPGALTVNTPTDTQAPSVTPDLSVTPAPGPRIFTLTAAGTVTFDSDIRKAAYSSESKTYDYTPSFALINQGFSSDICLATLENTLLSDGKLSDVNVTADVLAGLASAGLDMLALGHDHILDLGLAGLAQTAAAVRSAGFTVLGVQGEKQEAQSASIVNLNGVQVAFLHYADMMSNAGKRAIQAEDCAFAVPAYQPEVVAADIQSARGQGAQVVIVMIHWDSGSQNKATQEQQNIAQSVADAGADILLGAHSKVVLPIVYLTGNRPDGTKRPTLVCYSLGALLTGSRSSANIAGMLLHLNISFDPASGMVAFDKVEYTPTYIWRYKENGHYVYQVIASNQKAPENMDTSQRDVMQRALDRINKQMMDSPAKLRVAE